MSQRIMKHNPAFLSREELVKSFVARKEDLTFVLDHIADNTGASSQHLLIVAPRGMGKTTLVLRAAEAVRTEERFSKIWFPLVYAEETYEVMSGGELWLEGLRHLAEQTQDTEMLAAHRELRREPDEQRLYDRALGRLLDFADQQGKRILLVIENLHMLLDEQISKTEAWKLRKTLQNERRLMLLATATASFEAIDNEEQAFFDQFRIYRLEPLDLEGARQVWAHVAGTAVSAEHMRPLQILTGGNPRLLAILASFAGGMSLRALMGDLVRLVDDHTTYFKSNVDSLPAKERKVYVTLADLWQPSTAREVAEQARMSPSEVSALLNRLTQRGAVTTSGEDRRRVYQLAERMYNIYHLLRRSGGDETRVRAVVDFMVGFYDPVSLTRVVKAIVEEGATLDKADRADHVLVIESLFRRENNPRVREMWWKEAGPHLKLWLDTPVSLLKVLERTNWARFDALLHDKGLPAEEGRRLLQDKLKPLLALAKKVTDPADAVKLVQHRALAGLLATILEQDEMATKMLEQALEKADAPGRRALLLCCLAFWQTNLGRKEEAETTLREALRLAPAESCIRASLARLLAGESGRDLEAEQLATQAIDLNPSLDYAWNALFLVFHRMTVTMLATRATAYEPVLRDKKAPAARLAVAGLWAFCVGETTDHSPLVLKGVNAMLRAWSRGQRSSLLGFLLLQVDLQLEKTRVKEFLDQLSTSFDSRVIRDAFDVIWASPTHSTHLIAAPHLPVLLADKFLGDARLPLVGLLIVLNRWEEAKSHLQDLIPTPSSSAETTKPDERTLQLWTRLFADAAATGRAREALDLLTPSPLARWLEPVVVALHTYLGQAHRAPQEVSEVARDVVERIRARAAELQAGAKETAIEDSVTPAEAPRTRTKARTKRDPSKKPATRPARERQAR